MRIRSFIYKLNTLGVGLDKLKDLSKECGLADGANVQTWELDVTVV